MRSVNAENNKAIAILKAAEEGNYGVPGVVSVSIGPQQLNHITRKITADTNE
jgi:hypothetical protein